MFSANKVKHFIVKKGINCYKKSTKSCLGLKNMLTFAAITTN